MTAYNRKEEEVTGPLQRAAKDLVPPDGPLSAEPFQELGWFGMVGDSGPMRDIIEQIELVAPTRSTVLITGESGVGKELAARALHQLSRRDGPLVALNCASIPKDLAESELFGHAKGAFTGATERRKGKFEAADQGTLFIDEIGEMRLPVQAKLLRVLENQTITSVGSNEEKRIDVRVLAATNRDLRAMVEAGRFRKDLYYRLNVVHIPLCPLRQRCEDIPLLATAFLQRLNQEHGRDVRIISSKTMAALRRYSWPGNVRELRNVLERLVILSRTGVIECADLPPEFQVQPASETVLRIDAEGTLRDMECAMIKRRLTETGGNGQRAAKLLGISAHKLLRKINEYGLAAALSSADSLSLANCAAS